MGVERSLGGDCRLGGGGSDVRGTLVGGDCGLGGGGIDWGVEWWSGVVTNSSGE